MQFKYCKIYTIVIILSVLTNCISLPKQEPELKDNYNCMENYLLFKHKFDKLRKKEYKFLIFPAFLTILGFWSSAEIFFTGIGIFPLQYILFNYRKKHIYKKWKLKYCS